MAVAHSLRVNSSEMPKLGFGQWQVGQGRGIKEGADTPEYIIVQARGEKPESCKSADNKSRTNYDCASVQNVGSFTLELVVTFKFLFKFWFINI